MRGARNVAAYCGPGISHHRVRAAIADGELPTLVGASRGHVVLTDDVDAWLLSLRTGRAAS